MICESCVCVGGGGIKKHATGSAHPPPVSNFRDSFLIKRGEGAFAYSASSLELDKRQPKYSDEISFNLIIIFWQLWAIK